MLRNNVLIKKIGLIASIVVLAIIFVVSILVMAIGHDSSGGYSFWWWPMMIIAGGLLMISLFQIIQKIGESDEVQSRTTKIINTD